MAFERIGLGGVLSFDNQLAVRAMSQAQAAMAGLNQAASNVSPTMAKLGQAVTKTMASVQNSTAQVSVRVTAQLGQGVGTAMGHTGQAVETLGRKIQGLNLPLVSVLRQGLGQVVQSTRASITAIGPAMKRGITTAMADARAGITQLGPAMKRGITNAITSARTGLQQLGPALKSGISNAAIKAGQSLQSAGSSLKSFSVKMGESKTAVKSFSNALSAVPSALVNTVRAAASAVSSIRSGVNGLAAAAVNAGRNLVANLGAAANTMKSGFGQIGSGVKQLGSGAVQAAMGMLPLTLAVGAGAAKAATFEKQMSAVSAATGASAEQMDQLTKMALKTGAASVFTATESGQAMELLAKAGFEVNETMTALPGVLAAAAAESIPLSSAADIVAQVLRGMNLEAGQSTHVADTLAMAAAKTNTSILDLGESFKYGGSQSRALGFSLEETAGAFGVLADAGLRGSIGGTALGSMLTHLIKPSRKGDAAIQQLGISIKGADGNIKPMPQLIAHLTERINQVKNPVDRAGMAARIFGTEGARAFQAFAARGSESLSKLTESLKGSSQGIGFAQEQADKRLDNFLGTLTQFSGAIESLSIGLFAPLLQSFTPAIKEINEGLTHIFGAFQGMQDIQKNVSDQQKASTVLAAQDMASRLKTLGVTEQAITAQQESLNILAQQSLLGRTLTAQEEAQRQKAMEGLTTLTKGIKGVSAAEAAWAAESVDQAAQLEGARLQAGDAIRQQIFSIQTLEEIEKQHGSTALAIAKGVMEAIDFLKETWNGLVAAVKHAGATLEERFGAERIQQIAKFATIFTIVAAAVVPIILALVGFGFALTGLGTAFAALKVIAVGVLVVIKGAIAMVAAALWPVIIIVGVLALAFAFLRRDSETLGQTFTRVWGDIKTWALDVYNNAIKPFWEGLRSGFIPVIEVLGQVWNETWASISAVFNEVVTGIKAEFAALTATWGFGTEGMAVDWKEMGTIVANVIGAIAQTFVQVFGFLLTVAIKLGDALFSIIKLPFIAFDNFLRLTFDGVIDIMEGNFLQGVFKIATAIGDNMLMPIRLTVQALIKLTEMIPGVEAPDWLKTFSEQGVGGFLFPKMATEVATQAAKRQGEVEQPQVTEQSKTSKQLVDSLQAQLAEMGDLKAQEKARQAETPVIQNNVELTDKREVHVQTETNLDGDCIHRNQAKHRAEIQDRAGFKATPWQRRVSAEQGSASKRSA